MKTFFKSSIAAITLAVILTPSSSTADEPRVRKITNALTFEECSACHMAFQPGFLPERSWRTIMATLTDHFGEDASLSASATQEITDYLAANAMDKSKYGRRFLRNTSPNTVPLRITEFRWFTHEHGSRRISYANSNPDIGTISNCVACHQGADRGYFDDD